MAAIKLTYWLGIGADAGSVAAILGLEEGTVKSRVHRARLKLRAAVDALMRWSAAGAPCPTE